MYQVAHVSKTENLCRLRAFTFRPDPQSVFQPQYLPEKISCDDLAVANLDGIFDEQERKRIEWEEAERQRREKEAAEAAERKRIEDEKLRLETEEREKERKRIEAEQLEREKERKRLEAERIAKEEQEREAQRQRDDAARLKLIDLVRNFRPDMDKVVRAAVAECGEPDLGFVDHSEATDASIKFEGGDKVCADVGQKKLWSFHKVPDKYGTPQKSSFGADAKYPIGEVVLQLPGTNSFLCHWKHDGQDALGAFPSSKLRSPIFRNGGHVSMFSRCPGAGIYPLNRTAWLEHGQVIFPPRPDDMWPNGQRLPRSMASLCVSDQLNDKTLHRYFCQHESEDFFLKGDWVKPRHDCTEKGYFVVTETTQAGAIECVDPIGGGEAIKNPSFLLTHLVFPVELEEQQVRQQEEEERLRALEEERRREEEERRRIEQERQRVLEEERKRAEEERRRAEEERQRLDEEQRKRLQEEERQKDEEARKKAVDMIMQARPSGEGEDWRAKLTNAFAEVSHKAIYKSQFQAFELELEKGKPFPIGMHKRNWEIGEEVCANLELADFDIVDFEAQKVPSVQGQGLGPAEKAVVLARIRFGADEPKPWWSDPILGGGEENFENPVQMVVITWINS